MSHQELPERPNLEHLKNQAKLLQRACLQGDPVAIHRIRQALGTAEPSTPKLADALHVIATEYGFQTWPKLKAHVGALSENPVEALTEAVKANDAQLVRQVLNRHPILKTKLDEPLPNYGFNAPALIAAVGHENREMIDLLLNAGANINARTKWWAGSFGVLDTTDPALVPFLIERGAYVDIHAAARLGMVHRVKELLGTDPALVHARGGDGQTPLHFAATVEIAGILLDAGAHIDTRDIDHESTPAQYMASIKPQRPEIAAYLISRGARTDILMAAALGDLDLILRLLAEDPARVFVSVSDKDFPRQNFHSGGSIYIYGFGWNKTPHMLARESGHEEAFRLLMQRSPEWLQFTQACELGDQPLATELITKHPGVAKTLPDEVRRRIVFAANRNDANAVQLMLQSGWPSEALGDHGQTALHWASWHGNIEMVRHLLSFNSPLEAQEREFKGTPLTWAFHGSQNSWHRETGDYGAIVQALLSAGAKAPENASKIEASEEALAALRQAQTRP